MNRDPCRQDCCDYDCNQGRTCDCCSHLNITDTVSIFRILILVYVVLALTCFFFLQF